jgi:hypothetical protein
MCGRGSNLRFLVLGRPVVITTVIMQHVLALLPVCEGGRGTASWRLGWRFWIKGGQTWVIQVLSVWVMPKAQLLVKSSVQQLGFSPVLSPIICAGRPEHTCRMELVPKECFITKV